MYITKVIQRINFFLSLFGLLSNVRLMTKAYCFDVFARFFTQSEDCLQFHVSPWHDFSTLTSVEIFSCRWFLSRSTSQKWTNSLLTTTFKSNGCFVFECFGQQQKLMYNRFQMAFSYILSLGDCWKAEFE